MTGVRLLVLAALVLLPAGGCVSVRYGHGYVLERGETSLAATPGLDTKESILAKYGEPSMIGTFDPNVWYYMASVEQARAFFRPRSTSRRVVAFHFDDNSKVQSVDNLTLADSVEVKLAAGATPTRGKELSFFEQLLGNVGKLPAGNGQGGPGGGPGGPDDGGGGGGPGPY
ncbi:MAG TPA: outer membrane protein assembly factor BamE [Parvularculaceae bacterium]|nr:outer membrane protein assembly factor BamE [Parvularculaceae bacterium]